MIPVDVVAEGTKGWVVGWMVVAGIVVVGCRFGAVAGGSWPGRVIPGAIPGELNRESVVPRALILLELM